MKEDIAALFIGTIVGVRSGEYSLVPVCPQAHAFFSSLDCMDCNGNPEAQKIADVLKDISDALIETN